MAIRQITKEGDPALRKKCRPVTEFNERLGVLIDDMWDTMYKADGVGLAAPQVSVLRRIAVVDVEDGNKYELVNPVIVESEGSQVGQEGCLSIPDIREDVKRKETIVIEYYDENFVKHTDTFSDMRARVIQHEYDHIEGILFTDHLSSLKKKLVKGKLVKISHGDVAVNYKMRFPK